MIFESSYTDNSMDYISEDLSTLCRLCALETKEMTPIFDLTNTQIEIIRQIRDCLPIVIQKNDSISNLICSSCKDNLKKFHEFRNNVIKANEIFENEENTQKASSQMINKNSLERKFEKIVDGDENNKNKSIQISCRICNACNQVLLDEKSIAKHDENCHKLSGTRNNSGIREILLNSLFKCEFCDLCYADVKSSRIHKACHFGEKPYVCLNCNIYFSTYEEVTDHKMYDCEFLDDANTENKSTIPKYFSCRNCDETFMYFNNMNIHEMSCKIKSIDRFKCRHCGDRFMNDEGLNEHNSMEINEKWQCQRCSTSFGSVCALLRHKKKRHAKQFVCADCDKEFLQKSHIAIHVTNHMNGKQFSCDLCDKTFKIKSERNKHRSTHMGALPFKCSQCEKSFSTASKRRNHMKFHIDPKPFRCNVCDKAFKRFSAKKIHMTIHTGEKAFKCEFCDVAFKRKADMRKHKRTRHGAVCTTVALMNV